MTIFKFMVPRISMFIPERHDQSGKKRTKGIICKKQRAKKKEEKGVMSILYVVDHIVRVTCSDQMDTQSKPSGRGRDRVKGKRTEERNPKKKKAKRCCKKKKKEVASRHECPERRAKTKPKTRGILKKKQGKGGRSRMGCREGDRGVSNEMRGEEGVKQRTWREEGDRRGGGGGQEGGSTKV